MTGTPFSLEVRPKIPARLRRIEELAGNLLYTWDREVRTLFRRMDSELWDACGHNPKVFLRRIAQARLERAVEDHIFLEDYNRVLSFYDTYLQERIQPGAMVSGIDPDHDLIAYFCAEYGFSESFPIYSGGLGILAADHCKAASDLGVPFVAVGLLYRQGDFAQAIDCQGRQEVTWSKTELHDLPIALARDRAGEELRVRLDFFPGRSVALRVWEVRVGHVRLYLLDSDVPGNTEADRSITFQLYTGDETTRIQQQLVLGVGGVRALRALGLAPSVWHINEGYAAFQVLERCREHVSQGMAFDAALEAVAHGTVFTSHTPLPAAQDVYDHGLLSTYLREYLAELRLDMSGLLALGASPGNPGAFNMTALALRGSRFRNGVSRVHGGVTARTSAYVWPQVPPEENPVGYVTNGVHIPTFLAREWYNLFDLRFGGGWRKEFLNADFWRHIDEIPAHSFWSVHQSLKTEMLYEVQRRLTEQYLRNGCGETRLAQLLRHLDPTQPDILVLGFARRITAYKRPTLLFSDLERLARLVGNPERPVLIIFAGKTHPTDHAGHEFIRQINEICKRTEFQGKVFFVEGYDLSLARRMVAGVDVWLNTPEYPMEASGTSGQKAGINGVINLSVLDGWWAEGYDGHNGWAINPHPAGGDPHARDRDEALDLMELLERHVIPAYYQRQSDGYPETWVAKAKASMRSLMSSFNAQRMFLNYLRQHYVPAATQRRRLLGERGAPAAELARWRTKVADVWPRVSLRMAQRTADQIDAGEVLSVRVAASLDQLAAQDVVVECLVGKMGTNGDFRPEDRFELAASGRSESGETLFHLDLCPRLPGLQYFKLRMYPHHPLLGHRFETGCMIWL